MENTNSVKDIQNLAVAAMGIQNADISKGDQSLVIVPKDWKLHDFDNLLPQPRRTQETAPLHSVESFCEYINQFKRDNETMVFGMPGSSSPFIARIDYHTKEQPSWGEHKATLVTEFTTEWKDWTGNEKRKFSQREFSHFIDDNAKVITTDLAPLLLQVKEVNVKKGGHLRSKVDSDGENADASSSVRIETGVPEIIDLGLSIWKFSDPFKIQARIYCHVEDEEITFSYHLINSERALEQLFQDYRQEIADRTDLPVYV